MRFATVALIFSNAVIWLRCSLTPHLAASDEGWRLVAACPHKVVGFILLLRFLHDTRAGVPIGRALPLPCLERQLAVTTQQKL